jgi:hypothetical protein
MSGSRARNQKWSRAFLIVDAKRRQSASFKQREFEADCRGRRSEVARSLHRPPDTARPRRLRGDVGRPLKPAR